MAEVRVDTIVRGGRVVTSSQAVDASIAIKGEKIVALGPEELLPQADRYIDAEGKFVLPGLIDSHVHMDGHDDYALGSLAAAHAGLTTLIPFANYELDRDETLVEAARRIREEVEATALVGLRLPLHPAEPPRHTEVAAASHGHGIQVVQDGS